MDRNSPSHTLVFKPSLSLTSAMTKKFIDPSRGQRFTAKPKDPIPIATKNPMQRTLKTQPYSSRSAHQWTTQKSQATISAATQRAFRTQLEISTSERHPQKVNHAVIPRALLQQSCAREALDRARRELVSEFGQFERDSRSWADYVGKGREWELSTGGPSSHFLQEAEEIRRAVGRARVEVEKACGENACGSGFFGVQTC